jgi:membrane-associated phospholipid phosphatase
MEAILQWGLDCIRLIQTQANPPLTVFMRVVTIIGSPAAYIVLLPFIYWCVDEKKCLRLGTAALISWWANLALKFFLDQPRPFFEGYDPSVGMISETMGGFPSGHAQNSLVVLMIIASWQKNRPRSYAAAAVFCILIGFSRIYLGVHFPTDIFGGWLLGGLILCVYFFAAGRIEAFLAAHSPRAGLIAACAAAFAMNLYRPSVEMVMPAGMLVGLGAGFFLCRRYTDFNASVTDRSGVYKYLTLLVRYALGITVMILIFVLLEKFIGGLKETDNYQLYLFMQFILIALWVAAGAPWLFCILRLAKKHKGND